MRQLLVSVQKAAVHDAAVLINGETGVGKEIVARAIHHYSGRSEQPWVDVSCPALPESLVESELFGHERGAFSGADTAKPGLFELANHGTLFLDEIGEIDVKVQGKLLRILDGVPYFRLGGTRKITIDVRIVAATNRNLGEMVRQGRFRSDLYHRLTQLMLTVPPLRKRRDDIAALADFFLATQKIETALTPDALSELQNYSWPGNVRELRNVLVSAAVFAPNGVISARHLPEKMRTSTPDDLATLARAVGSNGNGHSADWRLENMERRMIFGALKHCGGHRQKTADLLGISRRTLSRKLKAFAVE
jgi:DNA-binding NtrC family response regulator